MRVAIVGAGPVGLWTAIQLRLRMPEEAAVVCLERNETYQRTHTVVVPREEIEQGAAGLSDPNLQRALDAMCGGDGDDGEGATITSSSLSSSGGGRRDRPVGVRQVERALRRAAEALGVAFVTHRVSGWDDPVLRVALENGGEREEGGWVVIAADGARSRFAGGFDEEGGDDGDDVRSMTTMGSLGKGGLRNQEPITMVRVDYCEVGGDGKACDPLREAYPTFKLLGGRMVTEVVRGDGRVTLFVHVDDRAHPEEALGVAAIERAGATARDPLEMEERWERSGTRSPVWLCDTVRVWQNLREARRDGARPVGRPAAHVVRSGFRAAEEVVTRDGRCWLVGDAAVSSPFMRGISVGFRCGSALARSLAEAERGNRHWAGAASDYASFVRLLADGEALGCAVRSWSLGAARWFCEVSRAVPWQTNRWSESAAAQLCDGTACVP